MTCISIVGHLAVLIVCLATLIAIAAGYLPSQFIFILALGGALTVTVLQIEFNMTEGVAMVVAMGIFAMLEVLWVVAWNSINKIITFIVPAAFGTLLLIFLATVHTALGPGQSALAALAVFIVGGWCWTKLDHDGHQDP